MENSQETVQPYLLTNLQSETVGLIVASIVQECNVISVSYDKWGVSIHAHYSQNLVQKLKFNYYWTIEFLAGESMADSHISFKHNTEAIRLYVV